MIRAVFKELVTRDTQPVNLPGCAVRSPQAAMKSDIVHPVGNTGFDTPESHLSITIVALRSDCGHASLRSGTPSPSASSSGVAVSLTESRATSVGNGD